MFACILLRPCPFLSYNWECSNVLISALVYIKYHIPRIKPDEELRPCSNIMKQPGEMGSDKPQQYKLFVDPRRPSGTIVNGSFSGGRNSGLRVGMKGWLGVDLFICLQANGKTPNQHRTAILAMDNPQAAWILQLACEIWLSPRGKVCFSDNCSICGYKSGSWWKRL